MIFAFAATALFAVSVIAASRSVRLLGSNAANFWRLLVAAVLLGIWAHLFGCGFGGGAFGWFFISGVIGFGVGDLALFQALPRLGPRLSSLMINCLAAPFGAITEFLWLDTRLSSLQLLGSVVILIGVGLALAPDTKDGAPANEDDGSRSRLAGILYGVLAGFGQGLGAVISRRAFALAAAAGGNVDGGTAAYQRILGGVSVAFLFYGISSARRLLRTGSKPGSPHGGAPARRAALWVTLNALAGPAIGVAFYQLALKSTPSGLVLPITATTPLLVVPWTYWMDGDRPSPRSMIGAILAVAGVVVLVLAR